MTLEASALRFGWKKCTRKIKVMKIGPLYVFFPGPLELPTPLLGTGA
jgi:hypothetical protein